MTSFPSPPKRSLLADLSRDVTSTERSNVPFGARTFETRRRGAQVLFGLVTVLGLGCGGTTSTSREEAARVRGGDPVVDPGPLLRFPDADTVERTASRFSMPEESRDRIPAAATASVTIPPYAWSGEPHERTSPLGAALAELTARRPELETSAATECVASTTATVVARNNGLPDDVHERLIAFGCGLPTPLATTSTLRWQVDPNADLTRVHEEAIAELDRRIGALPSTRHVVGAAIVREGRAVAAVITFGPASGRFDEGQVVAESGVAVVRGAVDGAADYVIGVITQGELGAASCESAEVTLPRFELRCTLEGGDDAALVDVLVHRPGRATFDSVGTMFVRRSPEAVTLSLPQVEPAEGTLAFEDALAQLVQSVRGRLGLPPLRRDEGSAPNVRTIAPAMVASAHARDVDAGELLFLGLIAGRGAEGGWIRTADAVTAGRPGKVLPHRWLTFALLHPNMRFSLVAPDVDAFAVGAVDGASTAAAVVTYRFYDEAEREADADAIFATLDAARRARGLPPPRRAVSEALRAEVRRVREGRPGQLALDDALQGTVREWSRDVSGLALELMDPRFWEPPEALLRPDAPILDVAVEYRRPEGGDWGQMVALLVLAG